MSFTSEALIVGEDFISEHFFTTDAKSQSFQALVLARRKEWEAAKAEHESTVRSRYTEARNALAHTFASIDEWSTADTLTPLYDTIRTVLGYTNPVRWEQTRIGGEGDVPGPVVTVQARGLSGPPPLVIIDACAGLSLEALLSKDSESLLHPFATEDGHLTSVARALSHLFVAVDAPSFALVLSGGKAVITQRERWLEGRTLAVDLQLIGDRNDDKRGGEIDRALTCLSSESLAPEPDGTIWWTGVLGESIKHTVGVSKDLREGVRESIEIIANDVVRRRRQQELEPLADDQAPVLAGQSLRFLYRILFLLYAEASPELGVVPTGDQTYERGYSVDRLRELLPTELATARAQNGTHFFDSLAILFDRVDRGYNGSVSEGQDASSEGLVFRSMRADLFAKSATYLIDETKLSNSELQRVLRRLLMSKEQRGKDRGFISYAELGINQLGAVYEGLMSYTGFFAHETLYEVAKKGDPEKGSWVVPETRIEGISKSDFVTEVDEETGEVRPVSYSRGEFVYRLAGRERQQSASYYTPEVLTRFTVGQALEELLDQDGTTTTAAEILNLTVCEPALGSGAFAIEAVRQLAEQYLTRRQQELDLRIDPDQYATELQKVKAHIALHQVYGVDLNATAVEFAEISLWLDTMGKDLNAPWFGLHLRRGNSLIGARRAVIPAQKVTDKGWIDAMPVDVPLSTSLDAHPNSVHHFLLPAAGWGATADAKEARSLAKDEVSALNTWRRSLKKKLTASQVKQLRALAKRVEELWALSTKRIEFAESEIQRDIPLWGTDFTPTGGAVPREDIEQKLADPERPYQRLRRAMDAWCAMWFWPLTEQMKTVDGILVDPPTIDEWIEGLTALLGTYLDRSKKHKTQQTGTDLFQAAGWDSLNNADDADRALAQAKKIDDVLSEFPWFIVAERVAKQQGFFHWELDFCSVFARGGFDLQVGNPPWVRPTVDMNALLAESDPWFQLASKPTQATVRARTDATLTIPGAFEFVVDEAGGTAALGAYLRSAQHFPHLGALQPDLYRCFMEQAWRHSMPGWGVSALIHPETHFTDDKAITLRRGTYSRLRRHWQFVNELKLYEIDHHVSFGVHVYSSPRNPSFLHAASLYHPDTVVRSFSADPSAAEPGLKDADGNWDVRPHPDRISRITVKTLTMWRNLLEEKSVPPDETRMVYSVNKSSDQVLAKLSDTKRLGGLSPYFSSGWHEKSDRKKGYFDVSWGVPDSWDDAILQGPHFHVATPFNKTPNSTMKSNLDWSPVDLETLAPDAIPATSYKPTGDIARYNGDYTSWEVPDENSALHTVRARDQYRIAWRRMAAITGERTLISVPVPPGIAHVDGVSSLTLFDKNHELFLTVGGILSSLVADFSIRATGKSDIRPPSVVRLPLSSGSTAFRISLRFARLALLTDAYADAWRQGYSDNFIQDSWTIDNQTVLLQDVADEWTADTPLRRAIDRRQALVEIDALVALGLGLTADELCTIYRTQFPVLYGYDKNKYLYDSNGRIVPQEVLSVWKKKGDAISLDERTATNASDVTYVYELPFQFLDREADMRHAYEVFKERLAQGND